MYIQTLYVTGPGNTGLIYTKYTCLYYGTYLMFCMCYPKSVSFIEFLMDLCICDDIVDTIQITDKTLLHVKLSKSGQVLRVDKTCFPRPGHILYILIIAEVICFFKAFTRPASVLCEIKMLTMTSTLSPHCR